MTEINLESFGVDLAVIAGIFFSIEAAKWILGQNKVQLSGWIWALIVLGTAAAFAVIVSLIRGFALDQMIGNVLKYIGAAWVYDMKNTIEKSGDKGAGNDSGT